MVKYYLIGECMLERLIINTELIESKMYEESINSNFMEIQTRREEQRIGWFVASPGILIDGFQPLSDKIYKHDNYFRTGPKLIGSVRKLNGNTTLAAQSLQLPRDMSNEGIKAFIHDFVHRDEVSRSFGHISLNEPGFPIFQPIKSETHGYIETKLVGKQLAAEAIERYLNTTESFDCDHSATELEEQIKETYAGIRANIPSYDEVLKEMQEAQVRLRQQEIYDKAHPKEAAARIVGEKAIIDALPPITWLPLS
jgi:hypothetical protein